jgi:hypothetical protein
MADFTKPLPPVYDKKTNIRQIRDMRVYGPKAIRGGRSRQSTRNLQLIRDLCAERARLVEEVKQLSAAVEVYKELLRRAEGAPFITEMRADAAAS